MNSPLPQVPTRRWLSHPILGWAIVLATACVLPHRWCAREGPAWYAGDRELQQRLANGVESWIQDDLGRGHFSTGVKQFDGEWLLGTYLMAGMGYGQTALEHPEWKAHNIQLMDHCLDELLQPARRAFDRESWGKDALETLDGPDGHVGYLGYINVLLSFRRVVDPVSRHAPINDRITKALQRRILASPTGLMQTYPGETYPMDNTTAAASIALHKRATGQDDGGALKKWVDHYRSTYIDRETGLLYQAVEAQSGKAYDTARGSGSGLATYMLSFIDPELSRDLFLSMRKHLAGGLLGFGMMREYPATVSGRGDIDSGPVILGYGVSATGFALSGARIHGDPELFSALYSTAYLFGGPVDRGAWRHFVTGGPLGDAMMFALLTAQPMKTPGGGSR